MEKATTAAVLCWRQPGASPERMSRSPWKDRLGNTTQAHRDSWSWEPLAQPESPGLKRGWQTLLCSSPAETCSSQPAAAWIQPAEIHLPH